MWLVLEPEIEFVMRDIVEQVFGQCEIFKAFGSRMLRSNLKSGHRVVLFNLFNNVIIHCIDNNENTIYVSSMSLDKISSKYFFEKEFEKFILRRRISILKEIVMQYS